jgi:hypothetical protein
MSRRDATRSVQICRDLSSIGSALLAGRASEGGGGIQGPPHYVVTMWSKPVSNYVNQARERESVALEARERGAPFACKRQAAKSPAAGVASPAAARTAR